MKDIWGAEQLPLYISRIIVPLKLYVTNTLKHDLVNTTYSFPYDLYETFAQLKKMSFQIIPTVFFLPPRMWEDNYSYSQSCL